jgi:hypothetical protein
VATFIAISYPSLQQDPNVTTQSILTQISQQLSNPNNNGTIHPASLSQTPFSPSASVVFVNSVWFLSLVLSLTCALMATLLQQWARRYLQIVKRNHAPHVRAHIREYFSRGARKFRIFGLVEILPSLLLASVLLFFAGLVVFAFLANNTVARITLAVVGFCSFSYIALTIMPLIFPDCPYSTPLTSVLWLFSQFIGLSFFSVLHRGAKQLHKRWDMVTESVVKSLSKRHKNKRKSLSKGMISKLEKSAKRISIDIYKKTFIWTLHQLDQDHELEEFIAGIPGLYESDIFSRIASDHDSGDVQRKLRNIRPVLAALPGPTGSEAPLPWSIIRLAQRAIASNISKPIQLKRTQACLRALYYIPGAIRDLLASYAASKHYCLEILPLLNSPESLEIIEELWDSPNDDVALSVRCAAATVASFMITPPHHLLQSFLNPDVRFIGDDNTVQQFLANRLSVGASDVRFIGDDDSIQQFLANRLRVGAFPHQPRDDSHRHSDSDSHSDSARLQNIVCFLADIKNTLGLMTTQWWTADIADAIRQERRALFDARHTEEYRTGRGTFDHDGNRASPQFIPAAQQDLITLTLEILARDSVATAVREQREGFREACHQIGQVAAAQARESAQVQTRVLPQSSPSVLEAWAFAQSQATDIIEMVRRALEPVLLDLRVQMPTPHPRAEGDAAASASQMPVSQIESSAPPAIVCPGDTPGQAPVGPAPRPSPPPLLIFQHSMSSSAGLTTAVADLGGSPEKLSPGPSRQ